MTTDTLRDRIARATWISHRDRQLAQLGMKPSEYAADLPIPDWAYAIAEAVIAELGLTQEVDDKAAFRMEPSRRRYVTEWMSLTDDTTGDVNHD